MLFPKFGRGSADFIGMKNAKVHQQIEQAARTEGTLVENPHDYLVRL
jgi:hypothetical protein